MANNGGGSSHTGISEIKSKKSSLMIGNKANFLSLSLLSITKVTQVFFFHPCKMAHDAWTPFPLPPHSTPHPTHYLFCSSLLTLDYPTVLVY